MHNPASASLSVLGLCLNLGAPLRRGVAHGGSHPALRSLQSSCPRYSDLHRGLSPRLSMHSIHPSVHPSVHPSIHQPDRLINQSQSTNPQHHFHSINPSIHYCLRRVTHVVSSRQSMQSNLRQSSSISQSIDQSQRSVEPPARNQSINQSIDQSISSINHHQPE